MIKAIENKSNRFTYKELAQLAQEMAGTKNRTETRAEKDASGLQDVIIQLPEGRLFHQPEVFKDTLRQLKKDGFKLERQFPKLQLLSGRINPETVEKLESCGFTVHDNSEQEFLPPVSVSTPQEVSSRGKGQAGLKPWEMRQVDPAAMIGVTELRKTEGLTGKGVGIAVIDSGFDYPDYQPAYWQDFTETKAPAPEDQLGHGTHVIGDIVQMAPEARILALRVLGPDGGGRTADIVKALQWVIENKDKQGIQIVNLSLGSPAILPWQNDMLGKVVNLALEAGITVVCPVGNDGPKAKTIASPADVPHAIAVGSLKDDKTVSDFSGRGPTFAGDAKPDVMAPGEYLVSWTSKSSLLAYNGRQCDRVRKMNPDELRTYFKKNMALAMRLKLPIDILRYPDEKMEERIKMSLPGYYYPEEGRLAAPGTSFSGPEVAGVAALLLEKNPNLTPREVQSALMETARKVEGYSQMEQGRGLVQAQKAVRKVNKDDSSN